MGHQDLSFLLRDNNEVRCEMDFGAGVMAQKVFDFGALIPDPDICKSTKWGTERGLHRSTQHSRVHQACMEGSSKVFAAWLKNESAPADAKGSAGARRRSNTPSRSKPMSS